MIILSVAHAPQSPGKQAGVLSEYDISRQITLLLDALLQADGVPHHMINPGGERPISPYSWVMSEKVRRVDEMASLASTPTFALELHLQAGAGLAALYWWRNRRAAQIAESLMSALDPVLPEDDRHWESQRGHIPCPNALYWPEQPDYAPFFVGLPRPTSMILELGSITDRGEQILEQAEQIAGALAPALAKVIA